MHTTVGIAARWAAALSASRTLREWSQTRYGKAVPGVALGDVSVAYQLVGYPLVMLDATITATESLPVGRRF